MRRNGALVILDGLLVSKGSTDEPAAAEDMAGGLLAGRSEWVSFLFSEYAHALQSRDNMESIWERIVGDLAAFRIKEMVNGKRKWQLNYNCGLFKLFLFALCLVDGI